MEGTDTDGDDHLALVAAVEHFAKVYEQQKDKRKFFRKLKLQYDEDVLPVRATLLNLIKNYEEIADANTYTRNFIKIFQKHGIHDDFSYLEAYSNLSKMMNLSKARQHALSEFKGEYRSYRRGRDQKYIVGSVLIGRKGQVPWFWHSSEQEFGSIKKTYRHEGFVILVGDRLYLLGIGRDYCRQMTLRAVQRPAESPLPGILLTERSEKASSIDEEEHFVPLAAKTVLARSSLAVSDEEIDSYLKNESELDGVLYGWRRT